MGRVELVPRGLFIGAKWGVRVEKGARIRYFYYTTRAKARAAIKLMKLLAKKG